MCELGYAIDADIPMHVEVGDHSSIDKLLGDEVARQRDALLLIQLARDGELDLARQLRVDPLLGGLDRVPQRRSIRKSLGRAIRQHHLGMDDARLWRSHGHVQVADRAISMPSGTLQQPTRSYRQSG